MIFKYLEVGLDYGIQEKDFWEMTLAEFDRLIQSKKRIQLREDRAKASFDYILADLIGHSIARLRGSNKLPPIEKVYPTLFTDNPEEEANKKAELSAIRFKLFADRFNKKYKEV